MSLCELHYILGYGSLFNHESRKQSSNLDVPSHHVRLRGWQRIWHAQSEIEQQTYLGVEPCSNGTLNAALLPIPAFTPELIKREQDYDFVSIQKDEIDLIAEIDAAENDTSPRVELESRPIWLCLPKFVGEPNQQLPVYQSYVDTCLAGALELGGQTALEEFISTTQGWHHNWQDDRHAPNYPRAAAIGLSQQQVIDDALHRLGVLKYRD